jgi:nucleotide-binding universal stress UspA family protein
MFEKILLPLDGSELAEQAIPYVRELAGQLDAEVYLLHVCPEGHQNLVRMHNIYLEHTAYRLRQELKEASGSNREPILKAEVVGGNR